MGGPSGHGRRVFSDVDRIGNCKQCGAPISSLNKVTGPTGMFCSPECKEKHEAFTRHAQQLQGMRSPSKLGVRIRRLFSKLIVLAIVLLFGAIVLAFFGFDIPVIGPIVENVRGAAE